ncbi:DNA-binding transcriptional regulator, LysR family [Variovorax sp. PDC80]|uniref:LysR substrate-binding domain-containing protein n=1 Tax=Variovorax sp. PDC80 TaxID=1882827 RepID=UPI0008DF71F1|nr:LysR substrate-binding domain-containing protein [Variovorax sp. PDC80]SFP89177.1 DNA-binding transcriptional regulator, LysR family [Variovorax sp. PDC80]
MSRPLNFRQIEAFRAVMQTGTTTAAAAMLHTTQPSVSRLLAQIQSATQLKLFDIHKGRLRPTHEARQLFETVQRHFLGLDRIEQSVAVMRKSGAGSLRVGCTPALGLSVMPPVIHAFSRRYPQVHVNLQTVGSHALREGLLYGLYDVALTTSGISDPQIEAVPLHRSDAVCVLHPGHPLASRASLHVRDLKDQVLLTLNADDEIHQQFLGTLQQHRVEAAATVETTYSVTICMMAAQGTGIGIVNPYVASVFARDLKVLPLRPRCPVEASMALSPQSAPSAIAEDFVGLLKAYFRDFGKGKAL